VNQIRSAVETQTVAMKLKAESQEANFLNGICPLNSVPAIVVIRNGAVEFNLQSGQVSLDELKDRLNSIFGVETTSDENRPSQPPVAPDPALESDVRPPEYQAATESSHSMSSSLGYLDLQPSSGHFRLPNNAYDALRSHTQALIDGNQTPEQVLNSQLSLLERLPIFRDEVKSIRSRQTNSQPVLSDAARERLLKLPASAIKAQGQANSLQTSSANVAAGQTVYSNPPRDVQSSTSTSRPAPAQPPVISTPPSDPPSYSASQHDTQRNDYVRLQKQREQSQRDERERIKAQIRADREERRRKEGVWKQNEAAVGDSTSANSSSRPKTNEIRVQVRTFEGSTLRTTFSPTSNITNDVRPWIDESNDSSLPYNLKLILTPLPNRNIEASEEELSLTDLGIRGSCTLVMLPVKTFVESYTGNTTSGLVGSAVSGSYNLVTGTVGAVYGAVTSVFRGLGPQQQHPVAPEAAASSPQSLNQGNVRVRTLADQRREESSRNQQFYNGNALNFAPNTDGDESRKND
jgi:hypothetical protein